MWLLTRMIMLAILFVPLAHASGNIESLERKVDARKKAFDHDCRAAQQAVLRQFNAAIEKAKGLRMPATTCLSIIEQLSSERDTFVSRGVWPDNGDFAVVAFVYSRRLHAAFRPVARAFEQLVQAHLKADNLAEAKACMNRQLALEREVRGKSELVSGQRWHGTRATPRHSTELRLEITNVTGRLFEAVVHQNPNAAGHPVFELRGSFEGNHIACGTSRVLHGNARALALEGFVVGDKILMRVAGIGAHGQPVQGDLVWLRLH